MLLCNLFWLLHHVPRDLAYISRMLFNLKINKTPFKRVQRLHSEAGLICSWVQLNPQKDYSHPLTGPRCIPLPGRSTSKMAPLCNGRPGEEEQYAQSLCNHWVKVHLPSKFKDTNAYSIQLWKPEQMSCCWKIVMP